MTHIPSNHLSLNILEISNQSAYLNSAHLSPSAKKGEGVYQEEIDKIELVDSSSTYIDHKTIQYVLENVKGSFYGKTWEEYLLNLKEEKFLPSKKHLPFIQDQVEYYDLKDLIRLCYLTTFNSEVDKSPFGEKEVKIFRKQKFTNRKSNRLIKAALGVNIIGNLGSIITFVSAAKFSDDSMINAAKQSAIIAGVSLIAQFAIGITSWLGTGYYPNRSKTVDDRKQDALEIVTDKYNELATHLLDLAYSQPLLAKKIVEEIDPKILAEKATKSYLSHDETKRVFKQLKNAIKCIKENKEMRIHQLRGYNRSLKGFSVVQQ